MENELLIFLILNHWSETLNSRLNNTSVNFIWLAAFDVGFVLPYTDIEAIWDRKDSTQKIKRFDTASRYYKRNRIFPRHESYSGSETSKIEQGEKLVKIISARI